jgi:hypothetical protein
MTGETISAVVTGVGVLIAAGLAVGSIHQTNRLQSRQWESEQARRIGDWISKVSTSVGEAITLSGTMDVLLRSDQPLSDFSKVRLSLAHQCLKGQLVCVSLFNDKVVLLSTSPAIEDEELRQAVNNAAKDVETIQKTFVEYRDKFMALPASTSPVELIGEYISVMREKADTLKQSCNAAADKLGTFLSSRFR